MPGGKLDVQAILAEATSWSDSNESVSFDDFSCASQLTSFQALLEPFTHISSVPGKEIRGQMIEAFNAWLHVPEDKLQVITKVVSMLHTASLL